MAASPGNSATPPTLCCEYHGDKHENVENHDIHHTLSLPSWTQIKEKLSRVHYAIIGYILIAIVVLIVGLADLVLSVSFTGVIKYFDFEATEHVIGNIILIITVGVACVALIYSSIILCLKKCKALYTVSIIIGILALIQILLISFAIPLKNQDFKHMETSLTKSFLRAHREKIEIDIQDWNLLQSEFTCCGLQGPDDYIDPEATFLPPYVPYSCCASYKKNDTDAFEKWQRDLCVLNKTYYAEGCVKTVTRVLKATTQVTVGVSVWFIILEVLLGGLGLYLSKKCSQNHEKPVEEPSGKV